MSSFPVFLSPAEIFKTSVGGYNLTAHWDLSSDTVHGVTKTCVQKSWPQTVDRETWILTQMVHLERAPRGVIENEQVD